MNRLFIVQISNLPIFSCAVASCISVTSIGTPEQLFPVYENKKCGYINSIGKLVIDFRFDWGGRFSEGFAAVHVGETQGYINEKGALVIEGNFGSVGRFSEGLAPVKKGVPLAAGLYGYINKAGEWAISPTYADVGRFSDGLAWVRLESRNSAYIDRTGKTVIDAPPIPDGHSGGQFFNGIAVSPLRALLFDKMGKTVRKLPYDQIGYGIHEGMLAIVLNNKTGFVDTDWNEVIPPKFDDAGVFSEGLAAAKVGKKWGYIDKSGNIVVEPQFDRAFPFRNGLARVRFRVPLTLGREYSHYGFINRAGEFAIAPMFEDANDFEGGVAQVVVDGRICYMNKRGEYLWKAKDEWVRPTFPEEGMNKASETSPDPARKL